MLRAILVYAGTSLAILVIVSFGIGINRTLSSSLGLALMSLNIAGLAWAWRRIFVKKSIALAVGVIVIKYGIIGYMVYWLILKTSIDSFAFVLGITTSIPGLFAVAIDHHKRRTDKFNGSTL